MNDPDPINPNLVPPPIQSYVVVKPAMATRNSSNEAKLFVKHSNVKTSTKRGSKKGNSKNRNVLKEMDGVEYEEDSTKDMEANDNCVEANEVLGEANVASGVQVDGIGAGDNVSMGVSQGIATGSVGGNMCNSGDADEVVKSGAKDIGGAKVPVKVDTNNRNISDGKNVAIVKTSNQGVTGSNGELSSGANSHGMSQVNVIVDKLDDNGVAYAKGNTNVSAKVSNDNGVTNNGVNMVIGDIPVPFENNPILNPKVNVTKGSGSTSNAGGMVVEGNVSVWPSLKETLQPARDDNVAVNGIENNKDVVMQDSNNERKFGSFANALQGRHIGGLGNRLSAILLKINEFGREVVDMDLVVEEGSKNWCLTLVGYFVGLKMGYRELSGHLRRMWRPYHFHKLILNESGLYFLKFKAKEGLNHVLENGPWLVEGKPLFVQKWEAGMCMVKPEPTKVPIWVKIFIVPLEAWNTDGISRIASIIGTPIFMDRITASMCQRAYGRASFARVLVEVNANRELVDDVEICYSKLGRSMNLKVDYDWKPPLCVHCKVFGHDAKGCKSRVWTEAELRENAMDKSQNVVNAAKKGTAPEVWQEARKTN